MSFGLENYKYDCCDLLLSGPTGHFNEAFKNPGLLGHRTVVHLLIAGLEAIPIIGQIAYLIESLIVTSLRSVPQQPLLPPPLKKDSFRSQEKQHPEAAPLRAYRVSDPATLHLVKVNLKVEREIPEGDLLVIGVWAPHQDLLWQSTDEEDDLYATPVKLQQQIPMVKGEGNVWTLEAELRRQTKISLFYQEYQGFGNKAGFFEAEGSRVIIRESGDVSFGSNFGWFLNSLIEAKPFRL